jgi:hypothetical protein
VPYPVIPQVGFRSAKGLVALGILVIGVAMLIFGRLEYFFPLFVIYVSLGLVRAFVLGILERRGPMPVGGWFPGGQRETDNVSVVETVGDESREDEAARRHRRRRRRSRGSGPSDRPDRPNNPNQGQ